MGSSRYIPSYIQFLLLVYVQKSTTTYIDDNFYYYMLIFVYHVKNVSSEFDLEDIYIWIGQFETLGRIFHPETVFIFLPCSD